MEKNEKVEFVSATVVTKTQKRIHALRARAKSSSLSQSVRDVFESHNSRRVRPARVAHCVRHVAPTTGAKVIRVLVRHRLNIAIAPST
jgi:hypothetical protein